MKKILFASLFILSIISCSKKETEDLGDKVLVTYDVANDSIYLGNKIILCSPLTVDVAQNEIVRLIIKPYNWKTSQKIISLKYKGDVRNLSVTNKGLNCSLVFADKIYVKSVN